MPLGGRGNELSEKLEEHRRLDGSSTQLRASMHHTVSPLSTEYLHPESANCSPWLDISSAHPSGASSQSANTPISTELTGHRRFSMLKMRHASEPQLSSRYMQEALAPAPIISTGATTPAIVTTPPTVDASSQRKSNKRRSSFFGLRQRYSILKSYDDAVQTSASEDAITNGTPSNSSSNLRPSSVDATRLSATSHHAAPLSYVDVAGSTPNLPHHRYSESSRSERSGSVAYTKSRTPRTLSATTSSMFRFPHRKKKLEPLFPLPVKILPPDTANSHDAPRKSLNTPSQGTQSRSTSYEYSASIGRAGSVLQRNSGSASASPLASPTAASLASPFDRLPTSAPPLIRRDSTTSGQSGRSSPMMPPFLRHAERSRSGTMNSTVDSMSSQIYPLNESGRNSTTTTLGRNSLAGLKNIGQKFRNSTELHSPRRSSPGNTLLGTPGGSSNPNSFTLSREALVIPDREEGETPGRYLERLKQALPQKVIASILSKSGDTFSHDVLRSFLRTFGFFEEPLDMSVRKLLWAIDLPSEAQQIDRVIHALAERYHECNPGIFKSPDVAYFAAYSLIILHSDLFNKNNKHKMQRDEYQKNTGGQGIPDEILGYFYDNLQYTEFIQKLDEDDVESNRSKAHPKPRKLKSKGLAIDAAKPGKLDPYDLILEEKLQILRPSLRDVMNLDDPFDYHGTSEWNMRKVESVFSKAGILQLVSSRSRPEAFMLPSTITNPQDASPGIVGIKITKVGLLWRKGAKKTKTRSPWQEWGALLTPNQLFLVKNAGWAKGLVQQFDAHLKQGNTSAACVFRPVLHEFKPEASVPTQHIVALRDTSYKKHKNAFVLASKDGYDEIFLAENESEMNDWLATINYAATFKSCNVSMRPVQAAMKSSSVAVGLNGESEELSDAQKMLISRRNAIIKHIATSEEISRVRRGELDEDLRTARHLQVLAPILPKTREHVVLAAGRMAAKLRWLRFEIWRLQCHKDILEKELEEERKLVNGAWSIGLAQSTPSSPSTSSKTTLRGLPAPRTSKSSSITPTDGGKVQPVLLPDSDISGAMDEALATPSETLSRVSSPSQGHYSLPALSLASAPIHTDLLDDTFPPSPVHSNLGRNPSKASGKSQVAPSDTSRPSSRIATPTQSVHDADETPKGKDVSSVVEPDPDPAIFSSPEGRSKARRSLQRTLRESKEFRGRHTRSRKGKESSSSVAGDDAGSTHGSEVLSRSAGSFRVHGKKASVITFGSEWQMMSAEERLKLRRQAQEDDSRPLAQTPIEDESEENATQVSETDRGSYRGPRYSGLNGASFHVGEDGAIMYFPGEESSRRSSTSSMPMKDAVRGESIGELATYKNHEMAEDDAYDSLPENLAR